MKTTVLKDLELLARLRDPQAAIESAAADIVALKFELEQSQQKCEKLQEFKDYVHDRLDKMGVPTDPEPENNAEHGCRIEGRLNVVAKVFTDKLLKS